MENAGVFHWLWFNLLKVCVLTLLFPWVGSYPRCEPRQKSIWKSYCREVNGMQREGPTLWHFAPFPLEMAPPLPAWYATEAVLRVWTSGFAAVTCRLNLTNRCLEKLGCANSFSFQKLCFMFSITNVYFRYICFNCHCFQQETHFWLISATYKG